MKKKEFRNYLNAQTLEINELRYQIHLLQKLVMEMNAKIDSQALKPIVARESVVHYVE